MVKMDDKSKELFNMLDSAYCDPEIKGKQNLTDLILSTADKLEKECDYVEVISDLSRGISKYYMSHKILPEKIGNIYNFIKPDVNYNQLDSKALRDKEIASGLMASNYIF